MTNLTSSALERRGANGLRTAHSAKVGVCVGGLPLMSLAVTRINLKTPAGWSSLCVHLQRNQVCVPKVIPSDSNLYLNLLANISRDVIHTRLFRSPPFPHASQSSHLSLYSHPNPVFLIFTISSPQKLTLIKIQKKIKLSPSDPSFFFSLVLASIFCALNWLNLCLSDTNFLSLFSICLSSHLPILYQKWASSRTGAL